MRTDILSFNRKIEFIMNKDESLSITISYPWQGRSKSSIGVQTNIDLDKEKTLQIFNWLKSHLGGEDAP